MYLKNFLQVSAMCILSCVRPESIKKGAIPLFLHKYVLKLRFDVSMILRCASIANGIITF